MKKTMSMMLVLVLVLSSVSFAFGETAPTLKPGILISPRPQTAPADVVGSSYEEAVTALMAAGVVSGYKDGTFRPDNTVTRAEACAFLVNYLNPTEEERNSAADSGFTDVSGWATTFINYAVEKGIVSGYKDGTFRPGQKVNYQELAAMTVNALGIDPTTLVGGWPNAYINKAKELGMYENISVTKKNTDEANRGDTAEMIYSLIKYKDTSAKDAVVQRMVNSEKALGEVKSLSYETCTDLAMSTGEETVFMINNTKLDMIADPLMLHMLDNVVSDDEQETVEYYYVTEGDQLMLYVPQEGQWYKMSMGDAMTAPMPNNPVEDTGIYLKAYDYLRIEGKDVIGGKPATKLYCELSDEFIDEVIAEMGMVELMMGEADDESQALVVEIIQKMNGLGYHIWIDDETDHMVKVSMDMKDLMQSFLDRIISNAILQAVEAEPELSAAERAELKAELEKEMSKTRIDRLIVERTLTNINTIEEIKMPAEAKNAIDLGSYTEE